MTDVVREVVDWIAAYWSIPAMIGGVIAALAVFIVNILKIQKLRLEVAQLRRAREIKDSLVRLPTMEETLEFGERRIDFVIELHKGGIRIRNSLRVWPIVFVLAVGLSVLVADRSPLLVTRPILAYLALIAVIFVVGSVPLLAWWYALAQRERSRTRSELRRVKNELSTSAASSGDEQAGV